MAGSSSSSVPKIAIVGTFQVGKSTLMNCLLADDVADMGDGLPTTHAVATYRFADDGKEDVHLYPEGTDKCLEMPMNEYREIHNGKGRVHGNLGSVEFDLNRECLRGVEVLDTPGLDAAGDQGALDTKRTENAMDTADFLIFVVPNRELTEPERAVLNEKIGTREKPFSVLMNCFGQGPNGEDSKKVQKTICAQLKSLGKSPVPLAGNEPVWSCNVAWYWWAALRGHHQDRDREKLDELGERIGRHFCNQRKSVPPRETIRTLSNLGPVLDFFTGAEGAFLPLPAKIRWKTACDTWRRNLLEAARRAIGA